MIYLVAYLVGLFVTWVVAAKMFFEYDTDGGLVKANTEDKVVSILIGFAAGFAWPLVAVAAGVYKIVFGTKKGGGDE